MNRQRYNRRRFGISDIDRLRKKQYPTYSEDFLNKMAVGIGQALYVDNYNRRYNTNTTIEDHFKNPQPVYIGIIDNMTITRGCSDIGWRTQ